MVTPDPRDPLDCANGASQYLFYGGIIIIATNVMGLVAGCARQAALKVGGSHGLCRTVAGLPFVLYRMDVSHKGKTVASAFWAFCQEFWVLLLLLRLYG